MKLKITLIILMIFSFLMLLQNVYSQIRHPYELRLTTENGPDEITFHITSTSQFVWEHHFHNINYTYLTTETRFVNPDDITMPGNHNQGDYGWNSDKKPSNQDPFVGRGFYKITVEGKNAKLKVDCYGTEWVGGVDVIVMYDDSTDKFKEFYSGDEIDEVNLYDDPEGLQPTKPLGFRCTNANQTGEHPHFVWDGTQWPNGIREERTITVYYIIFRNLRRVATDITNLEWTDNSVTIGQQGTSFNYFVRAKLSKSPESERSDIVYITGNLSKKQIPESMNSSEKNNCADEFKLMNVVCHPNPVNPTTNIIYSLSKEGVVNITIYNLMGQRIAELVNERKIAGTYQVSFDGSSLAGGIYFVHLEFNNQHLLRKILLIK